MGWLKYILVIMSLLSTNSTLASEVFGQNDLLKLEEGIYKQYSLSLTMENLQSKHFPEYSDDIFQKNSSASIDNYIQFLKDFEVIAREKGLKELTLPTEMSFQVVKENSFTGCGFFVSRHLGCAFTADLFLRRNLDRVFIGHRSAGELVQFLRENFEFNEPEDAKMFYRDKVAQRELIMNYVSAIRGFGSQVMSCSFSISCGIHSVNDIHFLQLDRALYEIHSLYRNIMNGSISKGSYALVQARKRINYTHHIERYMLSSEEHVREEVKRIKNGFYD